MNTGPRPVSIYDMLSLESRFGRVELHFVPRGREGSRERPPERIALPSEELGAADWSLIDPLPVRVSQGVPRGPIPALYAWLRHGPEYVWCESQFEKHQLMWLDWEGEIQRLREQPFAIVFPSLMSGMSWHVPDFLALHADGSLSLFDVRPRDQRNDEAYFKASARVCDELRWPYRVLDGSGQTARATATLKWLKATRHPRCAPPPDALDLDESQVDVPDLDLVLPEDAAGIDGAAPDRERETQVSFAPPHRGR